MSGLTDRMRTCAAMLMSEHPFSEMKQRALNDAANLLIEASNLLVEQQPEQDAEQDAEPAPEQLALEPFVFPPAPAGQAAQPSIATWTAPHDTLPGPRPPRACPQCDSRTHKKVFRQGRQLMLACPVCAKEWPYG